MIHSNLFQINSNVSKNSKIATDSGTMIISNDTAVSNMAGVTHNMTDFNTKEVLNDTTTSNTGKILKDTSTSNIAQISNDTKFLYRLNFLNVLKGMDASRQRLWKESYVQIIQSPLTGNSFIFPVDTGIKMDSHNLFLTMFMGTGIFGGSLFLYISFIGIKDAILTIRLTPKFGWLAAFFIGSLFACFFSSQYQSNYFFWFPLIALRANIQQYKQQVLSDS
jgi:hypothetical protein